MLAVDTAAAASLAAIVASTAAAAVVDSTAVAEGVASTAVVAADRTVVAVTDKKRPIYSASPAASAAGLFYCQKCGLVE
jgi:hypothetical protein